MSKQSVDVAVIGAGPAGLAAAVSAKQHGADRVIVCDRNTWLGGILPQCIHDGFGVEETGTSLTGPEYAERYIKEAEHCGVELLSETMVLRFDTHLNLFAVNRSGLMTISANAIVLATGCREKTRWHAMIPGDRPSGIYTAGVAQAFINLYNIMPGNTVVILGSGDVGLIMARRLYFEGAHVVGVVEMLPYASGLPRNVVQCLDDYGIPLFLNHTVTGIRGRERMEEVTIARVDARMNPIPGTEQRIACDALLLSLGLIPENELAKAVGIELDPLTGGPVVSQRLETTLPGVFACGNCLQVYDTVDMLALDAKRAGASAAHPDVSRQKKTKGKMIMVRPGEGVRYVLPQRVDAPGDIPLTLRVEKPCGPATVHVTTAGRVLFKKTVPWANPANIIRIELPLPDDVLMSTRDLEVRLDVK